jgi:hypothetical protein
MVELLNRPKMDWKLNIDLVGKIQKIKIKDSRIMNKGIKIIKK